MYYNASRFIKKCADYLDWCLVSYVESVFKTQRLCKVRSVVTMVIRGEFKEILKHPVSI
jgi:hypothetical protein